MDLFVEINVVNFPVEKLEMCTAKEEWPFDLEPMEEWSGLKERVSEQRAKIHMIKIGPLTEAFLSKKKLNPALDFLPGIKFTLAEDNDYLWTSGEGLEGLPIHSQYQLLHVLSKMGYNSYAYCANRLPQYTFLDTSTPVQKHVYVLEANL